tara:strand:+ start:1860 stop:2198 length:339 start_codon:yes stop_codon:yes gene_type:complete
MITITENADIHLSSIISENNFAAIKLAVKGGGCSGFTYDWQPITDIELDTDDQDHVIDLDTGKLIIDSMSILYLVGMEVDYKKDLFGQRLMVENPNVKSMCGCGESFHVEVH